MKALRKKPITHWFLKQDNGPIKTRYSGICTGLDGDYVIPCVPEQNNWIGMRITTLAWRVTCTECMKHPLFAERGKKTEKQSVVSKKKGGA
jgi:hypothetical protein